MIKHSTVGETVTFKESNIVSTVEAITLGKYKNITNNYILDKGQRKMNIMIILEL